MDTEEIIEGLRDGIPDHKLDLRDDLYIYIMLGITKLQDQEKEISHLNAIVDNMLEEN